MIMPCTSISQILSGLGPTRDDHAMHIHPELCNLDRIFRHNTCCLQMTLLRAELRVVPWAWYNHRLWFSKMAAIQQQKCWWQSFPQSIAGIFWSVGWQWLLHMQVNHIHRQNYNSQITKAASVSWKSKKTRYFQEEEAHHGTASSCNQPLPSQHNWRVPCTWDIVVAMSWGSVTCRLCL